MKIKVFFRGVVFLALLFVVLYVGMSNTHSIDFFFPLLLKQKVSQPAALLFFGMFAIGVVAGLMLHSGNEKPVEEKEPARKKK